MKKPFSKLFLNPDSELLPPRSMARRSRREDRGKHMKGLKHNFADQQAVVVTQMETEALLRQGYKVGVASMGVVGDGYWLI